LAEGKQLATGFEYVVVDAGGCDSVSLRSALLLAKRVVIPVGVSNLDAVTPEMHLSLSPTHTQTHCIFFGFCICCENGIP
jgi:plasmid segregation oscillating ATPase ParF